MSMHIAYTPGQLCDVTLTPRYPVECTCGTYPDNMGPCLDWLEGAIPGRCVYCDHTKECHDKAKAIYQP